MKTKKILKNKKGIAPLVLFLAISGIVAALGLAFGIGSAIKVQSVFNSIPTWAWISIAIVLFLILIPRR